MEFLRAFERDKCRAMSNLSRKKTYRRQRQDPLKVSQMRKYFREYKRFFKDEFNIEDEITVRDPKQIKMILGLA